MKNLFAVILIAFAAGCVTEQPVRPTKQKDANHWSFQNQMGLFVSCYQEHVTEPSKWTIDLDLTAKGAITDLKIETDVPVSAPFKRCMETALGKVQFGPQQKAPVHFTDTMIFQKKD